MGRKKIVVTIDGPAGSGKSTVAKMLARKLGFFYVDTGAMYRGLTWKAWKLKVPFEDVSALADMTKRTKIDLCEDGNLLRVYVDDEEVTDKIRTENISSK